MYINQFKPTTVPKTCHLSELQKETKRTTIEVINTIGQNVQYFDLGVVSGNQLVQIILEGNEKHFYVKKT